MPTYNCKELRKVDFKTFKSPFFYKIKDGKISYLGEDKFESEGILKKKVILSTIKPPQDVYIQPSKVDAQSFNYINFKAEYENRIAYCPISDIHYHLMHNSQIKVKHGLKTVLTYLCDITRIYGFSKNNRKFPVVFNSPIEAFEAGYVLSPRHAENAYRDSGIPVRAPYVLASDYDLKPGYICNSFSPVRSDSLPYNSKDSDLFNICLEKMIRPKEDQISDLSKAFAELIPNSFATENEAVQCRLHLLMAIYRGLMPLRDGSLGANGLELASVPLEGPVGFECLKSQMDFIKLRMIFDTSCATHIHYQPRFKNKEESTLALYLLGRRLQDEIIDFYPNYKKDEVSIARKSKNYADKLQSFNGYARYNDNEDYDEYVKNMSTLLYKYVSLCNETTTQEVRTNYRDKWRNNIRYRWLNFVPLIVNKQETIEYRIMEPMNDYLSIVYNLIVVSALVEFARDNSRTIIEGRVKIHFEDIIAHLFKDKTGKIFQAIKSDLMLYLNSRRDVFKSIHLTANMDVSRGAVRNVNSRIMEIEADYVRNPSILPRLNAKTKVS